MLKQLKSLSSNVSINDVKDEVLNKICDVVFEAAIKKLYSKTDFEKTEKWLRYYMAEEAPDFKLGKMHKCFGMYDVRKISDEYEKIDCNYAFRTEYWCMAVEALNEKLTDEEKAELAHNKGINAAGILLFKNGDFAILDTPKEHHFRTTWRGFTPTDLLHCETGPAIVNRDGSTLYALNNVTVPSWIVTTPADELDPARILAIENVDVRAEGIRKCGVERFIEKSEELDVCEDHAFGPYYVRDMEDMFDGNSAVFLQMTNPSSGKVHVEGVDVGCNTVQKAINWRSKSTEMVGEGVDWNPCEMDGRKNKNGIAGQYQQGDVCILELTELPAGGKKRNDRQLQDDTTVVRHIINRGDVYDYDGYQVVVNDKSQMMTHPEDHNPQLIPAIAKIWTTRESDPITGAVRNTID